MSKNLRHFIFYFLTIFIVVTSINKAFAQDRYWVNGSGTWNDTNHWSEISGGKSGASIPTKENHVVFDDNSFTAINQSVLIKDAVECNSFNWNVNKYTPSLKSKSFLFKTNTKATINVYGSLFIEKNQKNEFYGNVVLKGANENQINVNTELYSNIIIDAANGEYQFKKDFSTQGSIFLKSGSLKTNNYNINSDEFIGSGTEQRDLYLGSSIISVNNWDFAEIKNLKFSSGESVIEFKNQIKAKNAKLGNLDYFKLKSSTLKSSSSKGGAIPVIERPIPTDSVSCNGGADGKIYVYLTGATDDPVTYKLHKTNLSSIPTTVVTSDDTVIFSGLSAAKYYVWVIDNDGDDDIGVVNVFQPAILKADSIGVNSGLNCWNGSDAVLEAYASGANTPYSYQWIKYNTGTGLWDALTTSDPANKVLTGVSQGWYKVLVTGALGCDGVKDAEIYFLEGFGYDAYIPDSIDITGVSFTNTCNGFSTGSITVSATGGTTPLKYAIVRTSDSDSTLSATGVFNGLQADTYKVYAIDANDCFKRDADVTISSLANPTASILPVDRPADACPGIPLALDGNPSHGDGSSFDSHVWTGTDADSLDSKTTQLTNFTSLVVGSYDVIYTVTDNNGCSGSDNLTIVVDDTEDPVAVCQDITVQLDGTGNVSITGAQLDGGSTDNCTAPADLTFSAAPNSFTCANVGPNAVTLTVTDKLGNFSTCAATVTVEDNIAPSITCPGNVSVNNDATLCTAVVNGIAPVTNDNCGVVLQTWSMVGATVGSSPGVGINDISGTNFNSGVTTITYYIEDAAGNSNNCNFTVTVNDTENPIVTCPGNVSVNNDATLCTAVVNGLAPVTGDNCGVVLQTWSMVGATVGNSPGTGINDISGTTFNSGVTTISYYIEDAAGNSDNCNFTVTVNDTENPAITCPGNVSVSNDATLCSAIVNGLAPITSDNCGVVLQTWSMAGATVGNSPGAGINDVSGTAFNTGITTITYYIEDAAGNSNNCNFTVTVNDTENPNITCPSNTVVASDAGLCTAVVNGLAPITSDNCGVVLQTWSMVGATVGSSAGVGINDISGTTFNSGITTVTYYIEDAAGNSNNCNFTITVTDTENPVVTCPANVSVNNDATLCTAVVNGLTPVTSDNCGVVLQTWSMAGATLGSSAGTGINDISGTNFNSGVTTVTYYVEDAAGNSDNCNFTVTVNDVENPVVTCPGNVSVNNDATLCTAVVNGLAPITSDNCGVVLQTWSMVGATVGNSPGTGINDISGTAFNSGVTTVTYYIEDAAGNSDICNFTVTVNDTENPNITCPSNTVVANDAGLCTAVVNGLTPITSDNCGVVLQTWSMVGATVGSSAGVGINDISGTTFNSGVTTITYYVEDAAGNSDNCNFTVTVNDNENPVITCPGNVSVNNDATLCTAVVNGLAPVTSDNCGVVLQTWSMVGATVGSSPGLGINDISGTNFNSGVTTITYYIEDAAGNSDNCNFTVTVNDTENPVVTCPGNVSVNNDAGLCSAVVNGIAPITSDNCGVVLQTWSMVGATIGSSPATGINDISGTTFNSGVTTITYYIEDAAGNSDNCNFTVTVNDTENPNITCPSNTVVANNAGLCSAVVNGLAPVTSDNCGVVLQTWSMVGATIGSSPGVGINDISGTTFNTGVTTITYYIEDAAGNSDNCNFTVTVIDSENPTITCPSDALVIEDGSCSAVVNGLAPTTGDNCGVTVQNWTMTGATINAGVGDVSGETFNIGVTTVTYHIEDAAGNFTECSFDVEIYDVVDGGLINADQTVCFNTTPNPFTDEAPASVCGGLTYQWQMKSGTGPWGDIPGATGNTYTELNPLTEVTYYNRKAISTLGFGTAYSDTIMMSIQPEPIAFAGKDTTICFGSLYQILDADTTNSDGVSWEILTGNGGFDNINIINPEYTPGVGDGGTIVELVLHASGKGLCGEATDTIRITYPSELLVSIGKPTPFYIDSTSTHINVYFKIESHRYIGDLGLYLVSPLDSIVELKTYCSGLLSATQNITARFYNDPYDTSAVYASNISACFPVNGNYKFLGDWKKKLHGQDPANGAWRVRIGDNRNISGSDGFLREATVTFSDTNMVGIFESILLADSSINISINESPGGGDTVYTDRALPITGLTTSCYDVCDAAAVSTASGGTGPYTYAWNTSLDFTTPIFVDDSVYLCPGKYYVQATDSLGCTAIDSVTVSSPPEIKITNSTIVQNSCYGDSIGEVTLEFSGGSGFGPLTYTYDTYTGAAKLSGETFDMLKPGPYLFTITDGSGCTKDTAIILNGPSKIDVTTIITDITCYGVDDGQIEITASGGTPAIIPPQYLYSVDSANTWFPGNVFAGLAQDTFYIAVQDSLGCIQFADTIEMLYPDTISIDSVKVIPTTCFGSGDDGGIIVFATGGSGPLEFSTDNITYIAYEFGDTLKGLPVGDTTVYVKDNCTTKMLDSLVTITGPIPIVIDSATVVDVNTCFGDLTGQITVYASGGTGIYEYLINGIENVPPSSNVFTGLGSGSYLLTVRDNGGCISPGITRIINEPTELIINSFTIIDASECNPTLTGSVTVNAVGGTGILEYNVDGGAYQLSPVFTGLAVGNHTFTVRDANSCVTPGDAAISLIDPLTVSFVVTDLDCNGDTNGQITASPADGTPGYSFLWETGEITASINGLGAGFYTVTITDSNNPVNCVLVDSAEVQGPDPITIFPDIRHKKCIASSSRNLTNSLGRIIIDPDGGTPAYGYEWSGPSSFTSDNDTIINLNAGLYNLTITDSKDCKTYFSATIVDDNSYDVLSFDLQFEDKTVCWNDSVRFTSTYTGIHVDTILIEAQTISGETDTWYYTVDGSPYNGNSKISEKVILWKIWATTQYCRASLPRDTIDFIPDFELDIIDGLDGNAEDDTIYLKGSSTGTLSAFVLDPANLNFSWYESGVYRSDQPNVQILSISPDSSSYYTVIATLPGECADTSSIYLEFIPAITPNSGFSPNDDGINDYWKIKFIDKFPNNTVTVYSRWGLKVFEQKGYSNGDVSKSWNGKTKNGKDLPSGTYYYVIILNEEGFDPITGPVTIIR